MSVAEADVSLRKTSAKADIRSAIFSSSMLWKTRQSVASEGNPYGNNPFACRRFKWRLPNWSISALVIHLLSLPNMTSMSISSSLCLKFPLLVLRYSGTEDTNFLKWVMMLPRRQSKCFFFSGITRKKLYINEINRIFAIAKTKAEDNINIISYWIPPIKKLKMNDKKKHLRRCFRIAVHEYNDFYYNYKRWTIFLKWKSRDYQLLYLRFLLPKSSIFGIFVAKLVVFSYW